MRPTALLLPWALLPILQVSAMWPFSNNKPSAKEGLVNARHLGLEGFDGRVVALGDWNGDQLYVIGLRDAEQINEIWLWNRLKYKYTATHQISMPAVVHNVIASDVDYDGHLDLLIMSEAHETTEGGWWGGSSKDELHITVHLGGGELGGLKASSYHGTSAITQPTIIDADGTLKPSLLGLDSDSTLRLWRNNGSTFELTHSPLIGSRVCTLAQPHSSAFVDIDGDCRADIVLHCEVHRTGRKSLQIWRSQHDDGYTLSKQVDLPEGAGPITFADMDRDGSTDLVFPVCESYSMTDGIGYECSINIAYNKQVPMCSGTTSQYVGDRLRCRGWADLCVADHDFAFDFDSDGDSFTSFKLSSLHAESDDNNLQLYVPSTGNEPAVPLPLRIGDFNHDGYPDLLFLAHNATAAPSSGGLFGGSHRRPGVQPKLLESVACHKSRRECWAKVETGRRTFNDITAHHEALQDIWDAERVAWLDVDDNGSLDILVQRTGAQEGQHITFVVNNIYNDAFFMKTQVLNGACDGDCQPRQGGSTYKGLGASVAGASLKFTVLDTAGHRVAAQVSQAPQTAYHAMGTPYSFVGLGRTNNYIETLFIGTTLRGEGSQSILESLVPNSQVIINPPSVLQSLDDPGYGSRQPSTQWRNELFLQPGDWIPWVGATVVITVLMLGGVVILLGEKEKREDERDRRRALHSINFQAL